MALDAGTRVAKPRRSSRWTPTAAACRRRMRRGHAEGDGAASGPDAASSTGRSTGPCAAMWRRRSPLRPGRAFALVAPPIRRPAGRWRTAACRGRPWLETEIWRRDGQGSIRPEAMLTDGGLRPAALDLQGGGAGASLPDQGGAGCRAAVCDAVSAADLAEIAAAGTRSRPVLWVGSAGLALHLHAATGAEEIARPRRPARRGAGRRPGRRRRVGSANSSEACRGAWQRLRGPDPQGVAALPEARDPAAAGLEGTGRTGGGRHCRATQTAAGADPAAGARRSPPGWRGSGAATGRFGGLVATGGETARALLVRQASRSCGRGEVEPGDRPVARGPRACPWSPRRARSDEATLARASKCCGPTCAGAERPWTTKPAL